MSEGGYLKAGRVEIPLSELEVTFARSGGPGGQHVNRTESKVLVRWRPRESAAVSPEDLIRIEEKLHSRLTKDGDLLVTSEGSRSQSTNREEGYARLARLVEEALRRRKKRKGTRPTRASKERRIRTKKERGEKKRLRRPPRSAE